MNTILLLTAYTNAGKGEDRGAGEGMKNELKSLKLVKEAGMQCLFAV